MPAEPLPAHVVPQILRITREALCSSPCSTGSMGGGGGALAGLVTVRLAALDCRSSDVPHHHAV